MVRKPMMNVLQDQVESGICHSSSSYMVSSKGICSIFQAFLLLIVGAPVAQWVKLWPTDPADPGSSPA